MKTRSKRRMKPTVRGTDDQEYRHISQSSTSSEAKFDGCPVTTPTQHIIYTTAQLHKTLMEETNRSSHSDTKMKDRLKL